MSRGSSSRDSDQISQLRLASKSLRVFLGWLIAAAGALAIFMSWGALHDLALHVGGMPPDRAIVFPIVVDLPALAAMLIALLVPAPSRFLRALPWFTFTLFSALTVAGNAAAVAIADPRTMILGQLPAVIVNAVPAIALLPLALLWFGLGQNSLIFVLVHPVLWPLSLSIFSGFQAVPETLRMAGRNYGLKGWRYVVEILLPAALPSVLSGLKIAWAFAWRTLIAAELVFGASSGRGGLGWYIFQNRNELYTDNVFAGLALVILIGLLVENLVFASLERVTVRRWGQQR